MTKTGQLLRDAWRLTLPYFQRSDERWRARLTLLGIIAVALTVVGGTVLINFWYGQFYDALQNKDLDGFIRLLLWYRVDEKNGFMVGFVPIVTVLVPLGVLQAYLQQLLQITWRRWMTNQFLGDYLNDRAYYTISLTTGQGDPGTDNPDQRIAEDIRSFTTDTLDLSISFISRTTSLFNFAVILWSLSGSTQIFGIVVPGYMLWGAIFYAVVGTWLTHLVGRPLVRLNFRQQKAEADFRFALVRFRENSEGVALSAGETEERGVLGERFGEVTRNWFRLMYRRIKLNILVDSYEQAAVIFPFILGAPRYFADQIALGGLMRIVSAFGRVQQALSWFVVTYDSLASWRATVQRLTSFQTAIAAARSLSLQGPAVATGPALSLREAELHLPDGTTLLNHADLTLRPGKAVVISGRSGTGKSTLFRAIAGIWPFGSGRIERAPGTYLFLPQRPYIPLGTLRHAVTYPGTAAAHPEAEIRQALADTGLSGFAGRLDEDEQPWSQILSGGEQQRLSVARALLQRPDWLFMDEATSSLDPEAEAELYTAIRQRLPDTTVVSIAHRPDVARYHDETVVFTRRPGSPGVLETRQPATMASTADP